MPFYIYATYWNEDGFMTTGEDLREVAQVLEQLHTVAEAEIDLRTVQVEWSAHDDDEPYGGV